MSGLSVPALSRLGLGGGAFLAAGTDAASPLPADRLIGRALELGITTFDVSGDHDDGAAEGVLGRALRGRRTGATIVTKVRGDPEGSPFSYRYAAARCEASLKRLRVERLDVYIVQGYDRRTPLEALEALSRLSRDGKIRSFGLSNFPADELEHAFVLAAAEGWTECAFYQGELSLLAQEGLKRVVPLCRRFGIGFMAYSPLANGLLVRPKEPLGRFAEIDPALVEAARSRAAREAEKRGSSPAVAALDWVLKQGCATVIVGPRTIAQLEELSGSGLERPKKGLDRA